MFRRRHTLQSITTTKFNRASNACTLCIAFREVNHTKRHIAAKHFGTRRALLGAGLAQQLLPLAWRKRQKFLEPKASHHPWSNAASNLRGFNRNRAATATGVIQRNALVAPTVGIVGRSIALAPTTRSQHRCSQGFFQRRVAFVGAPTAFKQ